MNRDLTKAEQRFVDVICAKLPPVIARDEVESRLGGIISPHTLKFYDLKGKGPRDACRVGRRVAYLTRSLLVWLVVDYGFSFLGTAEDLLAEDRSRPAA